MSAAELSSSCQGFAVSGTWAHLPLPWGLQLEPCHGLARREAVRGQQEGWRLGWPLRRCGGCGLHPKGQLHQETGSVTGRQQGPKMKESQPETGPQVGQGGRRLQWAGNSGCTFLLLEVGLIVERLAPHRRSPMGLWAGGG